MNVTDQENDKLINQAQLDAIVEGRVDYMCSYRINITGDECMCGTSKIPEALVATSGISATELFDIMAQNVPSGDERRVYCECMDTFYLLNAFNTGQKSVSLNHNYDMCGSMMLITTTINMYKNPLNGDVEGILYMFDMSCQYVEKKIQTLLIGRQFESVATINVKTHKIALLSQFLYIPEDMTGAALREADYEPHIKSVAENYIAPEEIETYMYVSSLENITAKLEKQDSYYFTVTSVAPDNIKAYKKFTYYYLDDKRDIIVSTMEDVTGVIEADSLTGLSNRRGFVREAEKYISESERSGIRYAILFLNIKKFKAINELYGIDGGDMVLRAVAARIKDSFLKPMVMGRCEADHFICLVDSKNVDYDKLIPLLHTRSTIDGRTIEIRGVCGIYFVDDIRVDVNKMCDRAKMAKQYIEDIYVKPYAVYEASMGESYMERALSVGSVNRAIENKEFQVYFQPVFDANTEKIASAEALVRWIHPEFGFVPPDRFVPALEETGLISKLDRFVFEETRAFIENRINSGKNVVPISTNLSWMDFYDNDMIDTVTAEVKNFGHPHGYIRFEVTETSYAGVAERNHAVIQTLRNMGAYILIDDFGSGYSSFSTITDYNFDILKLDIGFVRKIGKNEKVGSVIHSIIDMAHQMDIRVIAEGAETQEQVDFLKQNGCDYIQGYYFSKPLPMEDFAKLLDEQGA